MTNFSIPHWHSKADSYLEYQKQGASWSKLVPEIVFVLFICKGIREFVTIEEIGLQVTATYPKLFETKIGKDSIIDLSLVLLTLIECKKGKYISGNWYKGWKLTRKGLLFSKDVERRTKKNKKVKIVAKLNHNY